MDIDRLIIGKLRIKGERCACPWQGWNRDFSRDNLAQLFAEVGYKTGAEIGVRWGEYSKVLCESIPDLKLYCVDPYLPYMGRRPSQARMDHYFQYAQNLLAPYNATFIRKTSMDALADVPDGSLDFVYIDAMHFFDYVMMDIICWSKKVKVGGIVSGHDYFRMDQCGVIEATHAYTNAHHIYPWYLTNHVNTARRKEKTYSWFWVKK